MSSYPRETGIHLVGEAPWGTHFCQFYHTASDLIDVLVPYLKKGLESNEFCVWVTSDPLSVETATEAMRAAVPDFDQYLEKRQIEIFPHTEWYMKDGYFDFNRVLNGWVEKYDQAVSRNFDGIRVTGNTAWLESSDWSKFTEYEEMINQVIGDYRMLVLCTYSLDKCGSNEIIDVVSNHEFALIKRDGKWELIESTERRQAREELTRERRKKQEYLDIASVALVALDTEGIVTMINRHGCRMLGYSEEEVIGKNLLDNFSPPGTRQEMKSLLDSVMASEQDPPDYLEAPILAKNGKERLIAWHNTLLRDRDGNITGSLSSGEDITERKQAEAALLRTSEEANRRRAETDMLLEASRAVMQHKSFDEAARAIFDFCKELIGADSGYIALTTGEEYDVLFLDAGGRPCTVDKNLPMPIRGLRAVAFHEHVAAFENDFPNSQWMKFMPPGHVHLDNAMFAPLLIKGEPVGLLGLSNKPSGFTDNDAKLATAFGELVSVALHNAQAFDEVKKRRDEAEELSVILQEERDQRDILMENSPEANLALLDRDFNFLMVNTAYASSSGLGKNDFKGKNHFDLFPHEENEVIFRQVRDTGNAIEFKEKPFEYPDMSERGVTYWDWTLTPVKKPAGEVRALVLSLFDVTDKVKNRQLNEALNNINTIVSSTLDFDEIMRDVMEAASDAMGSESIILAVQEKDDAVFRYTRGLALDTPVGAPLAYEYAPVATVSFKTGETIAVSDTFNDDNYSTELMEKLKIRSSIATPLMLKEEIVGVMAFRYHTRKTKFSQSQIDFVEKLAVSISLAMENAHLYQKEQQDRASIQSYATRLSLLHKIGLSLNREFDKRRLLKTILEGAAELTMAGMGAIILVEKGKTDLISMYYAPWYTERCRLTVDATNLHKSIEKLVVQSGVDNCVRISFDDLEKPLQLPEGHPMLDGLLIGTLSDTRDRRRGYFMLSCKAGDSQFTQEDEEIISLLAAQSSVALISAENMEREHEVAATLQDSLLPDIPARQDLDVGLVYQSVSDYARIGGDFYDFIELEDGKLAVLVGDVCGKGLEAATETAMIKYTVRAFMDGGVAPGECLKQLNRTAAGQLPMEKFVTVCLAVLDPSTGFIDFSSAGHPVPLFCADRGLMDTAVNQAVPIGVLPDCAFKTSRVQLGSGCSLLMFTDGLIEARPVGGEPFGVESVASNFAKLHQLPAQRAAEKLVDAAAEYSAGFLRDDMALVLMKFR